MASSERTPQAIVDAAIREMARRQRIFDAAFQPHAAIDRTAKLLASPQWLRTLDQAMRNVALPAPTALDALQGLAAHESVRRLRIADSFTTTPLLRIAENMRRSLFAVDRVTEQLQQAVMRPLALHRAMFEQFARATRRFAEEQAEIDAKLDAFVVKHGWPVPLSLPARAYRHIVGLADRPKREVTAAMVEWFRPGTRAFTRCADILLEHPLLEPRRPLIRQVLVAHRRDQHYLVINSLMPLVEGVLVDALYANEQPPEKAAVEKAVGRLKDEKVDEYFGGTVAAVERLVVAGAAGMGLFSNVRRSTWGSRGEPRTLNRHAILHGFARRYGSRANALKMILLMDVLVQVAGDPDAA